jgi:hypothetical protein
MTDVIDELARYCAALDAAQRPVHRAVITSGQSTRGRVRRSRLAFIGIGLLVVAIAATAMIRTSRSRHVDVRVSPVTWQIHGVVAEASLVSIPIGVSVLEFGSTPTFVIRTSGSVRVFLTNVQHLPGEDTLWWCPHEKVFASPTHGEIFSADGDPLDGPAQRGLNELAVHISGDRVTARIDQIHLGQPRAATAYQPRGGAWDSGPGSFCEDPLKVTRSTSAPTVTRADAIQIVGRLEPSEIEPGATYAAKLTTNAANSASRLPQQRLPENPKPHGLLWLIAVHGHLHPAFADVDERKTWGVYTVDATNGAINEVTIDNTLPSTWVNQPDLGG